MSRPLRIEYAGVLYHVTARGDGQKNIYLDAADRDQFYIVLVEVYDRYDRVIHMCVILYTYWRSGTLWEGRFKSCMVDAKDYLLICQRYIELNPARAGMVTAPEQYVWSSYRANALGEAIKLWSPHLIYHHLGKTEHQRLHTYRELFRGHLDDSTIDQIRQATNKGMALGNDRFRDEIEKLTERRVTPMKWGPKPKNKEAFLL